MIEALRECGWAVDARLLEAARSLRARRSGARTWHRRLSRTRTTPTRLAAEQLTEPSAFLVAYLIEGRPAFREREAPTVSEAIELIHGAGGVAVWAHPSGTSSADAEVLATLDRFGALGLDGVEAFYVTHTRAQTELLVRRAAPSLDLLTTGSSDFHGPDHRQFNRFRRFETYGHEPNLGPIAGAG